MGKQRMEVMKPLQKWAVSLFACLLLFACCAALMPVKAAGNSGEHYLTPYQNSDMGGIYTGDIAQSFQMMGKDYHYGVIPVNWTKTKEVLYNLDGQFDSVSLYVGAVDGRNDNASALAYIYMDGELKDIWSLEKEMIVQYKELDTSGVSQLRIYMESSNSKSIFYGLGNVIGYGGHFYQEELTKKPTASKDGLRTYTCEVCGDSYTEVVPAEKNCEPMLVPYRMENLKVLQNTGNPDDYISVMGKRYYEAVADNNWNKNRVALFNLNQEYESITFTVGHRDNAENGVSGMLYVYADGSNLPMMSVELKGNMIDKEITLDTEGVIQLKFSFQGDNNKSLFYVIHSISYKRHTPKGHSYESEITLAADYGRAGIRTFTCRDCSQTYTEVIPALRYDISGAELALSKDTYTYNGTARKPAVTVKYNGTELVKDADYTVSYKNNVEPGKATVTVTGKGSYEGKVSAGFAIEADEEDGEDSEFISGGIEYSVISAGKKTVGVTGLDTSKASITIPATVKYNGVTYKVTAIESKAFYKESQLASVTVGKNVQTIGASAFANCSKLAKITVNATNLKSVGKNALKGTKENIQITVPSKKVDAYKKLFTGKGQTIKIVGK